MKDKTFKIGINFFVYVFLLLQSIIIVNSIVSLMKNSDFEIDIAHVIINTIYIFIFIVFVISIRTKGFSLSNFVILLMNLYLLYEKGALADIISNTKENLLIVLIVSLCCEGLYLSVKFNWFNIKTKSTTSEDQIADKIILFFTVFISLCALYSVAAYKEGEYIRMYVNDFGLLLKCIIFVFLIIIHILIYYVFNIILVKTKIANQIIEYIRKINDYLKSN